MSEMTLPNPAIDPVLCHPFEEPSRHWELDARGTAKSGRDPKPGRRLSMMINPIPDDQKKPQIELDVADHRPNGNINNIREKVRAWRQGGYAGATATSVRLLEHWAEDHGRAQRPFFAQREAMETLVWLREIATRSTPERAELEREARYANDQIVRHAVKMATGTGKTVVMAMLIAWQTLNAARTTRRRNLQHGQRFVVLTPGLTIQRRLAVLKPSDPHNIYDEMYLVPKDLRPLLNRARVMICNYQSFQRQNLLTHNYSRAGSAAQGKAVKAMMGGSADTDQIEDYDRTVRRVLKPILPGRLNRKTDYGDLVVINDEAHHCYLPGGRDAAAKRKLAGGELKGEGTAGESSGRSRTLTAEEKQSNACASVWFNVIRALRDIGALGRVTVGHGQESIVYDFTATPFWIDTAQRSRPEQFGWVASDFGLMDAIESGLTKLPRAPVSDDSPETETIWRRLFENTKPEHKLVKPSASEGAALPQVFRGALDAQVAHWEETLREWGEHRRIPPVLIVVADTTANADAIFEYIAGWPTVTDNGEVRWTPGIYPELSNVDHDGKLHPHPRTMVIHSKIGDDDLTAGARAHFKHLGSRIVGWKNPKQQELADAVKEILNTVGKEGQPGEQVRCVISVQMLSEGWDARNVTHIVGYRAFSTQLLCEQVTGRALRRSNYEHRREDGRYPPEHADIVGIPFEFMPSVAGKVKPAKMLATTHVSTVAGRECHRITWPMVEKYRRSVPPTLMEFDSGKVAPWKPSASSLPTSAEMKALPPTEQSKLIVPDQRQKTMEFILASRVVTKLKEDGNASDHPLGFFPAALRATRAWLAHDAVSGPDSRHGLSSDGLESAAERILDACAQPISSGGGGVGRNAVLGTQPLDDTSNVDFETTLQLLHSTSRSEISHAACHSELELSTARVLDAHDDVESWVRNFRLGWVIPYMLNGIWRSYEPDFICRLRGGINLIIECKGSLDAKAIAAARHVIEHWIPCVAGTTDLPDGLRQWTYTMIFDSAETHGRITEIAAASGEYRFDLPRIGAADLRGI